MTIDHKKFKFIFNLRSANVIDTQLLSVMEKIQCRRQDETTAKKRQVKAAAETARLVLQQGSFAVSERSPSVFLYFNGSS